MLKTYNITLTIKTPTFIGSGTVLTKKDCLYVPQEKKVYILDGRKTYMGACEYNAEEKYMEFLEDYKQRDFAVFLKNASIPVAVAKTWANYTLPLTNLSSVNESRSRGGGADDIQTFVKDPYGKPYIPASSLKGAIRTAIQNAECIKTRGSQFNTNMEKKIMTADYRNKRSYLGREEKEVNVEKNYTLGVNEKVKSAIQNDIYSGLRIGDSNPLDVSDLCLCQKVDFKPDGTGTGLPIKRECLKPETVVTFPLEIDDEVFPFTAEEIQDAVYETFGDYEQFLNKFDVDAEFPECDNPIVIGGGAGFVSKTSVYALYKDRKNGTQAVQKILENVTSQGKRRDPHKHFMDTSKYKVSPHTRKCTKYENKIFDMGICDFVIE